MHLEDIFRTDEWFACNNILVAGEILPMPPVDGWLVFNEISNNLVKTRLGAANAVTICKGTVKYNEVMINEPPK
uniref:Uncharacterized protein n=1 Tax=Amphimedon queenslandica TaxID=400682 RepID=A0A1X7V5X3_AMPQE